MENLYYEESMDSETLALEYLSFYSISVNFKSPPTLSNYLSEKNAHLWFQHYFMSPSVFFLYFQLDFYN